MAKILTSLWGNLNPALIADFYEVDLSAKIQVHVPLHFVGKAAGIVNGGILQPILREIEVVHGW